VETRPDLESQIHVRSLAANGGRDWWSSQSNRWRFPAQIILRRQRQSEKRNQDRGFRDGVQSRRFISRWLQPG
jgi:hypothetical protein